MSFDPFMKILHKFPFAKGQATLGTFHCLGSTVGFCDPDSRGMAHESPYHKHLKRFRMWTTLTSLHWMIATDEPAQ